MPFSRFFAILLANSIHKNALSGRKSNRCATKLELQNCSMNLRACVWNSWKFQTVQFTSDIAGAWVLAAGNSTKEKPNVDLKTASMNIADLLTNRLTAPSPPQNPNIFSCNNRNATDMQFVPLELVKSNGNSVRKAREAYLIEKEQTLEPHVLNKKNET